MRVVLGVAMAHLYIIYHMLVLLRHSMALQF